MMVLSLFIIDLMGLFFLQQNRLHNIHRGFTHYKYYRAFLYRLYYNCVILLPTIERNFSAIEPDFFSVITLN